MNRERRLLTLKEIIKEQIISHYKILEKLGEGGIGRVYKVKESKFICTIYEISETEDGQLFIAMVYNERETF